MRKARLAKKRSADDLGVDELTDDLGVEIDTRPASQRARQSWPPSDEDEEDEAVDVDDEKDEKEIDEKENVSRNRRLRRMKETRRYVPDVLGPSVVYLAMVVVLAVTTTFGI